MKAYIFPGQGAQFSGMGKELYDTNPKAAEMFNKADEVLGFSLSNVMFNGTEEDLKQTKVTQPAVYVHSVILAKCLESFAPDMVAGHSLGEFSALAAAGAISFEDGLRLVSERALAMQDACQEKPSTMAAILGLADEIVERVCEETDGIVIPANYNCPNQIVISGEMEAVEKACEKLKEAGAKRALKLAVGGAFHSPLMLSAKIRLQKAIEQAEFCTPSCPIYQNVDAQAHTEPEDIKANLIKQLTAPVLWSKQVTNMVNDGATEFTELGPGKVLQGLVKKIAPEVAICGFQTL